jgi:sugar transferase (PEP-CTERM/EpsH1 system associated)
VEERPLVLHVVYRFDVGGLENGVVNLINHMPDAAFRHAVVALTDVTGFARRIRRPDVNLIALHKAPGHGVRLYPQLFKLFRSLRPAIVHTRNLAALEAVVPAWLAGVPVRVHGEHGRDVGDLDGRRRRYQWVRRAYRPFVDHYVALSRDLAGYLVDAVGVPARRVSQVYNGVDIDRFTPAHGARSMIPGCPFGDSRHWIIGTVGRMQAVKNPIVLVHAFVHALQSRPELRGRLRLVMVGDGPLRAPCQELLERAGLSDLAWLPGELDDVEKVLRGLDGFVLPSLAEGVSNTILEAMACGLPVVATAVGGNADLVSDGVTGIIVPPGDAPAIAASVLRLADNPESAVRMGKAGRESVESRFSLQAMVAAYQGLYESQLGGAVRKGH